MKNIKVLLLLCLTSYSFGQVAIGKENINGNSTILDFNDAAGNTNGIILSAVNDISGALSIATVNNNGTFLFDRSDNKVKMYENNVWVPLSDTGDSSEILVNTSTEVGAGVIIGAQTTDAKGVLVLESANTAMILPKIVNPHTSVKSPYPGMLCYDTVSKTMAVFDGKVWNYWK
ncbi:hypothetical protein [Empedobacter brevis]|uniref:hypothetical protein n=1 Tax=Empedobacter brevis TaxID=247 RepID=UPI0028987CB4|nr:hypothetical protein [Empedobacter brevis]